MRDYRIEPNASQHSGKPRERRKRARKVLLTLLLAAAMTFTLAGCGGSSSGSGSSSSNSTQSESQSKSNSQSSAAEKAEDAVSAIAASASGSSAGKSSGAVVLSKIPKYSGSPYVKLNHNKPAFKTSQLIKRSYEKYGSLDSLGRCTTCIANVSRSTMPTAPRGSIGMIKPTGWHTIRYSFVDGKYLYNRCHLIGYQLTGENANSRNLITGTRYMNVDGMEPFESEIAQYVKSTGNHVLYRVTPVFKGSDLLAHGVHMESESVEDHGSGIKFNIYCYNVEPGTKLNYTNGNSRATNGESGTSGGSTATNTESSTSGSTNDNARHYYVVNVNTGVFHLPSCSSAARTLPKNKRTMRVKRSLLISQGYRPCKICNP